MHPKIGNPSYLLLQFRNGNASNWVSLCKAMNVYPYSNTDAYSLEEKLRVLIEAGLLIVNGDISSGNIKLSDSWSKIQAALDLSLNELARVDSPRTALFVEPFFGLPKKDQIGEPYDLFVLMPFANDLRPVYEDHIKNVAASFCRNLLSCPFSIVVPWIRSFHRTLVIPWDQHATRGVTFSQKSAIRN